MEKRWEDLTEEEQTPEEGYREALRRIEECLANGGGELNLDALKLEEIPGEIAMLTQLLTLHLSDNNIDDISLLAELTELEELNLSNNNISDLRPLAKLESLLELNLGENSIRDTHLSKREPGLQQLPLFSDDTNRDGLLVPEVELQAFNFDSHSHNALGPLVRLHNLRGLNLFKNFISDIGPLSELTSLSSLDLSANEIIDLTPLAKLTDLSELNLSGNKILNLNPLSELNRLKELTIRVATINNIEPLAGLSRLETLDLSGNHIDELQPLAGLTSLQNLVLRFNRISDVGPLGQLTELINLNLENNLISDLSSIGKLTSLRSLYLDYNVISDLGSLRPLLKRGLEVSYEEIFYRSDINLYNNPIVNPPIDIVRQGTEAVLKYWEEQDRLGTQKAYEGRLMIVGEGKIGKTTLLNKLRNPDYQLEELPQTHGINIWRDWTFPVAGSDAEYRASVWDFGGQDIQHLTHQYFFTSGTVYLLLVNKRGSNAASEASQLNYWFRIIELMASNPPQKARVLVVHNVFAGDKSHQGFNLGPYQERYADTLEITFQEVNLAIQNGAFDDLRRAIQTALTELPGVGENSIKGWPDIRRELGKRREERRISWKEFGKICAPKGIEEDESKLLLTRYLARLGEILHYEHGGLLFDNVLLDIDWVTTAVYGITENQDIINRNGRFTREEIVGVWQKNGVTDLSDHELMLQLLQMDAFELCWKTEAGDYLTPTLFASHAPAAPPVRPDLGLRFHYDYLPKGLLGQLIVRLHKYLEADHYWQDGIFLARESCRARVSRPLADRDGERIIEIIVEGAAPRHYALLSLVVQELKTIHERSFRQIRFVKEIACPCERCRSTEWDQAYFSYDQLLQLRRAGDKIATCANQRATELRQLLEGMQELEKQLPMNFAQEVRELVSENRLEDAIGLLDRQYPSNATAGLAGEYRKLQMDQIAGILTREQEGLITNRIRTRLMALAQLLVNQPGEKEQRKTMEEQLPEIRSQLDRIEATGKDTNQKVTALGQILLHIGQEVENTREDLFVSRQEERQFMRKLEETVEQLPVPQQPGEAWYERPAKAKIKIALDLLAFVPGMSLKWEKELSKDGARVPRSWGEFKGWFLG